ncbi:MAG: hypothetical protein V3Q69_02940 [Burkholderia sp.]
MADAISTRGRLGLSEIGRCCINRAGSIDVYVQRSRGPPYQVRFQNNCLIFYKKMRRTYTRKVSRRHATVSGIGRPIMMKA